MHSSDRVFVRAFPRPCARAGRATRAARCALSLLAAAGSMAALAASCASPPPGYADSTSDAAAPSASAADMNDAGPDGGATIDDDGGGEAAAGDEAAGPDGAPAPIAFAAPRAFACGAKVTRVVAGDFNGDHHPDVAGAFNGGVCILSGRGDGTFDAARIVQFASNGGLAARDVNGDGLTDLALTSSAGIALALALPGGAFATPTKFEGLDAIANAGFADLDGDGAPDLVGGEKGRVIADLLSKKGEYRSFISTTAAIDGPFAAGDVDADGRDDIVAASGDSFIVLSPAADGTFGSPRTVAAGGSSGLLLSHVDGDAALDVVVQAAKNGAASTAVFVGRGDGTFAPPIVSASPMVALSTAMADLDRDQVNDLVLASDGQVYVQRGVGDGSFAAAVSLGTGVGDASIASVDLDGDGRVDLVLADDDTGQVIALMNATPR